MFTDHRAAKEEAIAILSKIQEPSSDGFEEDAKARLEQALGILDRVVSGTAGDVQLRALLMSQLRAGNAVGSARTIRGRFPDYRVRTVWLVVAAVVALAAAVLWISRL